MKIRDIPGWAKIVILVLVTLLVFGIPFVARPQNLWTIGSESYYDKLIIRHISEYGFSKAFSESLTGGEYMFQPYHFLITCINVSTGIDTTLAVQIFSGLTTVLLIYWLLNKLKAKTGESFIALLFIVVSPVFISIFTTINTMALPTALTLISVLFYLSKNKILKLLCYLVLIIVIPWSLYFTLSALFFIFFLEKTKVTKNSQAKKLPMPLFIVTLLLLVYAVFVSLKYGFYNNVIFHYYLPLQSSVFSIFISDMGGVYGISGFVVLLFLFGFFLTWKDKLKLKYFYYAFILLILTSFFVTPTKIFLLILTSTLAAKAFLFLYNKKWDQRILKTATILAVVCGILFSFVSFETRMINSQPKADIMRSLVFLQDQEPGLVFSHYNNGLWIQEVAQKEVFSTSILTDKKSALAMLNLSDSLFYSQDLDQTLRLMDLNGVKYIYVTPDMKQGLVWEEREGLLFLMDNAPNFEKIYDQNQIEIWELKGNENFALT